MEPERLRVEIGATGRNVEVWRKGKGRDVVFLHGAGGLPAWTEDLEALAQHYRLTVPIHPGFGASGGADSIEAVLDSVLHTFDVLEHLGLRQPDLIGHSMGGMLAAEMAATSPRDVGRLALVAPVGLWDDAHPVLDFFTMTPAELVPHIFADLNHPLARAMAVEPSDEESLVEMYVGFIKSLAAAGRLLWPIPDRGLARRLYRVKAPTLLLWGERDGLVPPYYAEAFARRIAGAQIKMIADASHMVLIERPGPAVEAIVRFFEDGRAPTPRPGKKPRPAAKRGPARATASRGGGPARRRVGASASSRRGPSAKKSKSRR